MFEVKVTIVCPDLLQAATVLATAVGRQPHETEAVSADTPQQTVTVGTQTAVPAQAPIIPGTEPPKFSIDDISRAGAELAQQGPDKITALTGLLQQFGLQAVTQLRPDQMGPFVLALRGLGARI